VNGVASALEAVSRELDELPGDLIKFVKPLASTYNCRKIAGTDLKSMHAYGAAVDINIRYANYWRWATGDQQPCGGTKSRFLSGAATGTTTIMHFEYRPELMGR
jgi:D-alanyl-D-alanine carboxypeptidase